MKWLKMIFILSLMPLILSLSACGDSETNHAASWSDATMLADDALARHPKLVADGNGNMIAVWLQSDGFYADSCDAVSGWGGAQKIGDFEVIGSDILIAVSRTGYAIVAWTVYDEQGSLYVHAVRFSPGSGWGGVENLGAMGILEDVAIDDMGNAFILAEFLMTDPNGVTIGGLTLARSDLVSEWRFDRIDYTDISTTKGFPKIAVHGSGFGLIMWVEGGSGTNKVYVKPFSQTTLGPSEQIASLQGIADSWTNIILDSNGNAMVLWGQADSSSIYHTYACYYSVINGWGGAERIDNSTSDCIEQSLAVDPAGNFYAIWTQIKDSSTSDIHSCRFTAAGGWQTPKLVGTGSIASLPRIAADAFGNLYAAWLLYDPTVQGAGRFGGTGKVYANYCRVGTDWGMQRQLTDALGDADAPALAVDRSGRAMAIWSQSTGPVDGTVSYGTFFSRFQ